MVQSVLPLSTTKASFGSLNTGVYWGSLRRIKYHLSQNTLQYLLIHPNTLEKRIKRTRPTSGKQAYSPGAFGSLVPVLQPGLDLRDKDPPFTPGCNTNRD
jgi:hypothetical protein